MDIEQLQESHKKAIQSLAARKIGIAIDMDPFKEWTGTGDPGSGYPDRFVITWDFCDYALDTITKFFMDLKQEHLKRLFGRLQALKRNRN